MRELHAGNGNPPPKDDPTKKPLRQPGSPSESDPAETDPADTSDEK